MNFSKEAGERLKELRRYRKFTQHEAAKEIKYDKKTIYTWEKNLNIPKESVLEALVEKVLGGNLNWILTGEGEMLEKHLEPVNSQNDNNNPWIPGNKPQGFGWYELTMSWRGVAIDNYFKRTGWNSVDGRKVVAHKRIIFSEPYVVPERELLCPFCNSEHIEFGVRFKNKFCCENCHSVIEEKTKKELLEIYDKLNEVKQCPD